VGRRMSRFVSPATGGQMRRALPIMLGALSLLFVLCSSSGCSPGYVMRAAYEQSKILLARRPIEEVIKDPATARDESHKLALVLEARSFASEIGLDPGGSFTQYADIGKDTLAWVVMGSRKDAFILYTWWFPIVGTVPYKGFFDLPGARQQAEKLEAEGYETSVRGTEAFSTLGWFNDPVMSTTLKNSPTRIVNTVIHESVHSTVWIPDHVSFNESLANFVGTRAAISFFKKRLAAGGTADNNTTDATTAVSQAEDDYRFSMEFADSVSNAFKQLSALYQRQDITSEQKIRERQGLFDGAMGPFRSRYPKVSVLRQLNNADLLQSTIYMTDLRLFERLYEECNESWPEFLNRIVEIKSSLAQGAYRDPFEALRSMLHVS
jgi:predicted aminopeptidase